MDNDTLSHGPTAGGDLLDQLSEALEEKTVESLKLAEENKELVDKLAEAEATVAAAKGSIRSLCEEIAAAERVRDEAVEESKRVRVEAYEVIKALAQGDFALANSLNPGLAQAALVEGPVFKSLGQHDATTIEAACEQLIHEETQSAADESASASGTEPLDSVDTAGAEGAGVQQTAPMAPVLGDEADASTQQKSMIDEPVDPINIPMKRPLGVKILVFVITLVAVIVIAAITAVVAYSLLYSIEFTDAAVALGGAIESIFGM